MSGDRDRGASDVGRYEQLRARVLSGGPDCFSMGLAMLERRGVAAWSRAWPDTARAPSTEQDRGAVIELPTETRQIVDVLATMALCLAAAG